MKLLVLFLLALMSLVKIASGVAITSVSDELTESSVTGDCHNGDEKCSILPITLLGRHSIKRCINYNWVDHEICNVGVVCTADPSPHCTVATLNGEITNEADEPAVTANEFSSRQEDCREGAQQCAYLDPIRRHIIRRCNRHNWVNIKVCEATETCTSGAAPQCVAQTVLSRNEDADEDGIDANLAHKADLPCTKCKRMRDDCFKNAHCRNNSCRYNCINKMKRYLVEDGRHGRYRGTCADYCPQLCR